MNPDSLRDYVEAFVQAGLARPVGSELKFFAERVDYFGAPNVRRGNRFSATWCATIRSGRIAGSGSMATSKSNGRVAMKSNCYFRFATNCGTAPGMLRARC